MKYLEIVRTRVKKIQIFEIDGAGTILDLQKLFEHLTIDFISLHLKVLKQVNSLEVVTRNDVVSRFWKWRKS